MKTVPVIEEEAFGAAASTEGAAVRGLTAPPRRRDRQPRRGRANVAQRVLRSRSSLTRVMVTEGPLGVSAARREARIRAALVCADVLAGISAPLIISVLF